MANDNETLADIVALMRRGTRLPGFWHSYDLNGILQYHADCIEAAARRAYNEIGRSVCSMGCVNVDNVRKVMNRTLGDYHE